MFFLHKDQQKNSDKGLLGLAFLPLFFSWGMCLFFVSVSVSISNAWTPVEPTPQFCAGWGPDQVTVNQGKNNLQKFASQYSDRAGWETRATIVREGIQKK